MALERADHLDREAARKKREKAEGRKSLPPAVVEAMRKAGRL